MEGEKRQTVGGSCEDGVLAAEGKRAAGRDMSASVRVGPFGALPACGKVKDSRGVRGDNWSGGRLRCRWPEF